MPIFTFSDTKCANMTDIKAQVCNVNDFGTYFTKVSKKVIGEVLEKFHSKFAYKISIVVQKLNWKNQQKTCHFPNIVKSHRK